MSSLKKTKGEELDEEWMALILTAKRIGITPIEVRNYFNKHVKKHGQKLKRTAH